MHEKTHAFTDGNPQCLGHVFLPELAALEDNASLVQGLQGYTQLTTQISLDEKLVIWGGQFLLSHETQKNITHTPIMAGQPNLTYNTHPPTPQKYKALLRSLLTIGFPLMTRMRLANLLCHKDGRQLRDFAFSA